MEDESVPVNLSIRRNVEVGPFAPNKKETINVAKKLIEAGLALPIRGYDFIHNIIVLYATL